MKCSLFCLLTAAILGFAMCRPAGNGARPQYGSYGSGNNGPHYQSYGSGNNGPNYQSYDSGNNGPNYQSYGSGSNGLQYDSYGSGSSRPHHGSYGSGRPQHGSNDQSHRHGYAFRLETPEKLSNLVGGVLDAVYKDFRALEIHTREHLAHAIKGAAKDVYDFGDMIAPFGRPQRRLH